MYYQPYDAVISTIKGKAWITGYSHYVVSPDDPIPDSFTNGDIWVGASAKIILPTKKFNEI